MIVDCHRYGFLFICSPCLMWLSTEVASCSLPWLTLRKPKRCYFRGMHRHKPSSVSSVTCPFLYFANTVDLCVCFQGDIIVAETDGDGRFHSRIQTKTAGFLQEIVFPCWTEEPEEQVCVSVQWQCVSWSSPRWQIKEPTPSCVLTLCVSACASVLGMMSCWCPCWRGRTCQASEKTKARGMFCLNPFL